MRLRSVALRGDNLLDIRSTPRRPTLLCLNLRLERLDQRAANTERLSTAAWCLRHARQSGWRVVHAHNHAPRLHGRRRGVIEGLQPLRDEPVHLFLNQSPFDCSTLWDAISEEETLRLYLIGVVHSRAGLAAIASAHERRLNVTLIEDACLGPDPDDGAKGVWLHHYASAFSTGLDHSDRVFQQARGDNVVDLAAWRLAPMMDGGRDE
jgi:nicotinamidase-related amidase